MWKLSDAFFKWPNFSGSDECCAVTSKTSRTAVRVRNIWTKARRPPGEGERLCGERTVKKCFDVLCFQAQNSIRLKSEYAAALVAHLRCCTNSGQLWKGKNTQQYQHQMHQFKSLCSTVAVKYQDSEICEHQLLMRSNQMLTTTHCYVSSSACQPPSGW